MLRDLSTILNRQEELEAATFKAAASRMLASQFLLREHKSDREAWAIVVNHFEYFENLFDALGWSLHRDDQFGLLGILPAEQENHARLKLVETLFLLVLRLLYEEGMDRFEVRDGCVFVDSNTLLERYAMLFKRELPKKTTFREILNRLRHHGILETGDADDEGMPKLRILPTVRLVTGAEVHQRIDAHCQAFNAGSDEDEIAAMSEGDEA